jgi:probable rRNA maturation factor
LKQINIKNIHPRFKIKKRALKILMENILTAENEDASVDLILVDDEFMQRLNRKFTGRKKTTDVISFGMKEGIPEAVEFPNLGDIYISLDQTKRQAEEYRNKFEEELKLLVAHGLLHLLGYDHRSKREETVMRKKEGIYLKSAKNV